LVLGVIAFRFGPKAQRLQCTSCVQKQADVALVKARSLR
jgi:hypothetical protein